MRTGGNGFRGQVIITWECPTYSLMSTMAPADVCTGNRLNVTLTGLPAGTYTVTYNLTGANTATGSTATMTVTVGVGTFATNESLSNTGSTTIIITNLSSGSGDVICSNAINSNNEATVMVGNVTSAPLHLILLPVKQLLL